MANKTLLKKAQYYVEYLGWKESMGLYGREFTEPIIRELLAQRRYEYLPRLTIQVSNKEIKVTQEIRNRKGKTEKKKFPPIPAKDVTFAITALPPDQDVVACIFLGFNQYTGCAVHVHVYRCDSEETASLLVQHMHQLIETPEHQQRILKIESELSQEGHVMSRMNNPTELISKPYQESVTTDSGRGSNEENRDRDKSPGSPGITAVEPVWNSLTAELQQKLNMKETPLLLPPKDYDTVCRRNGKLDDVKFRRSLQLSIVGPNIFEKPEKGDKSNSAGSSEKSGSSGDLPSPMSDGTNSLEEHSWKRAPHMNGLGLQKSASANDPYRHNRRTSSSNHSVDSFHSDGIDYNYNSRPSSQSGPYPLQLPSTRGRLPTDEGYTSYSEEYNPMFSPSFHGDTLRRKNSKTRRSITGHGGIAEDFNHRDDPFSQTTPASGFAMYRSNSQMSGKRGKVHRRSATEARDEHMIRRSSQRSPERPQSFNFH